MNVRKPKTYGSSEWFPPWTIPIALGEFDLDPCSHAKAPWKLAEHIFTKVEDGLKLPWFGRVWLCPPLSTETKGWLIKAVEHGNVIALLPSRTDTAIWHDIIFPNAKAILFLRGRIRFHRLNGSQAGPSASPSALIAFDEYNADMLEKSSLPGFFIRLKN